MVILLFVLAIIVFLTIDYFVQKRQLKKVPATPVASEIDLNDMPAGLFLHKGHVWQQLDRDGTVRVGADILPVAALGEIDVVDLPGVGDKVEAGEPLAVIGHNGRDIVLRAHTDGIVRAVNAAVIDDPAGISDDPYGDGWLLIIEPADVGIACKGGHIGAAARSWIREEFARFRDLLAQLANQGMAPATLQDGGLPAPGLSEYLEDDGWKKVSDWIADVERS